ncbi:fibroblast growth factor 23 [Protopterus annectens]|uniref:fibroblast growth factor 23 n=1 Tax=Protopterus annectens TaxID=7888 RepID=UPI001CFC3862|nr:fibroblast growth factor 23 [Protopterus annectens]
MSHQRATSLSSLLHMLPGLLAAVLCRLRPVTCALSASTPLQNPTWSGGLVHLYTATERNSFHLRINSDGYVDGSFMQSAYSALSIKAEEAGHVVIRGVKSGRYLCMDVKGNIFGSHTFNKDDCTFKHENLENGFNVYHSLKHRMLVSLGKTKSYYLPGILRLPAYSQFLVLKNEISSINFINIPDFHRHSRNLDIDPSDPHQMLLPQQGHPIMVVPLRFSPQFSELPQDSMRTSYNDMMESDDPYAILKAGKRISPRLFIR